MTTAKDESSLEAGGIVIGTRGGLCCRRVGATLRTAASGDRIESTTSPKWRINVGLALHSELPPESRMAAALVRSGSGARFQVLYLGGR